MQRGRLLLGVLLGVDLVQVSRVDGRGDVALAHGGDDDTSHLGERALGGGLVTVEGRSGGENGDGHGEADSRERANVFMRGRVGGVSNHATLDGPPSPS